jgi:hypothetical protein
VSWTVRDAKRDRETTDAIERQEDRGAAILAAAYLEDRLTRAIKAQLISDAKITNSFFSGMGPLATFSAKINLAYLMGIFNETNKDFFHTIRKIRNEFAHNLAPIAFENPKIERLCKQLYSIDGIKQLKNINDDGLRSYPEILALNTMWLGPLIALPNTPRNSYMNTIKVMLFLMEFATQITVTGSTTVRVSLSSSPGIPHTPSPSPPQTEGRTPRKRVRRRRSSPE